MFGRPPIPHPPKRLEQGCSQARKKKLQSAGAKCCCWWFYRGHFCLAVIHGLRSACSCWSTCESFKRMERKRNSLRRRFTLEVILLHLRRWNPNMSSFKCHRFRTDVNPPVAFWILSIRSMQDTRINECQSSFQKSRCLALQQSGLLFHSELASESLQRKQMLT